MGGVLGIMTPEDVADELQTSTAFVMSALETGTLSGLKTPDGWRTTVAAVRAMIENRAGSTAVTPEVVTTATDFDTINTSKEVPTLKQLASMQWQKVNPFTHVWPAKKGEQPYAEHYNDVYALKVEANGKPFSMVIAFGIRDSAGDPTRPRAVVFRAEVINGHVQDTRYPIIEFSGGNDFVRDGKMVSVIYGQGRSQVRPDADLPMGYEDMPVGVYNSIVSGPYASSNRCVVAHKTDFAVMARHALLRCRQKRMV